MKKLVALLVGLTFAFGSIGLAVSAEATGAKQESAPAADQAQKKKEEKKEEKKQEKKPAKAKKKEAKKEADAKAEDSASQKKQ